MGRNFNSRENSERRSAGDMKTGGLSHRNFGEGELLAARELRDALWKQARDLLGTPGPLAESSRKQVKAQQVAPIFFKGQKKGQSPGVAGDALPPGQDGMPGAGREQGFKPVTERPWRATWGQVAPGFYRKVEVPPGEQRQGFDAKPPAPTGEKKEEKKLSEAEQKKLIEEQRILEVKIMHMMVNRCHDMYYIYSPFVSNLLIGGTSGALGGGPLARWLDRLSKNYVAGGQSDVNEINWRSLKSLRGWGPDAWAVRHQRLFGLADNDPSQAVTWLSHKIDEANKNLKNTVNNMTLPVMERLKGQVEPEAFQKMTGEQRQTFADHRYLNSTDPPKGLDTPPSPKAVYLRTRISEIVEEEKKLDPRVEQFNAKEFDEWTNQAKEYDALMQKELDATKDKGEILSQKFKRAGEAALSSEDLDMANKYRFFRDYLADTNKKPEDYDIKLTADDREVLNDPDPHKASLKTVIKSMENKGKLALDKFKAAGEEALTPEDLGAYNRYRFFRTLSSDWKTNPAEFDINLENGSSDLSSISKLNIYKTARGYIGEWQPVSTDYPQHLKLRAESFQLEGQWDELRTKLAEEVIPLEKKLDDAFGEFAKSPIARKYNYLKNGAFGKVPAGIKLNEDEAAIVSKIHGLRSRIALLNPTKDLVRERSTVLAPKMGEVKRAMLQDEDFKDIYTEVEKSPLVPDPRPKNLWKHDLGSTSLNDEQKLLWKKYDFFQDAARGEDLKASDRPPAHMLSRGEAKIVDRFYEIKDAIKEMPARNAKAAIYWRAKRVPDEFHSGSKVRVGESHLGNFAKGMAAVAAADFLADRIDNCIYGEKASDSHRGSFRYLAAVTPWLGMALPRAWPGKIFCTTGLAIAAGGIEHALPVSDNSRWGSFLKPRWEEAAGLGLATTLPLRNSSWQRRLGLMAAGYGIGKLAGYMADSPPLAIRDKCTAAYQADRLERTARSMNKAIDQLKELDDIPIYPDRERRTFLDHYLNACFLSPENDVEKKVFDTDEFNCYRGRVMFETAAGEARLEKGSRVGALQGRSDAGYLSQFCTMIYNTFKVGQDRQFDYVLSGENYDLGGLAMTRLESAREYLKDTKRNTGKHINEEIKGKKVSQSEIDDLNKAGERITDSLKKIYGAHDIAALLKQVQQINIRTQDELRKEIKKLLEKPNTNIKRYIAKLYRDLALIDLAMAGNKMGYNGLTHGKDGEAGALYVGDAMAALEQARKIDPSFKDGEDMDERCDYAQLKAIGEELTVLSGHKIKAQWMDHVFNPLEIPRESKK